MSNLSLSVPFDLTGEFGGIVFTDAGKRRLQLRVGETDRLFKVPKYMRRRLVGNFRLGQSIRVSGVQERDALTGKEKWLVEAVLSLHGEPVQAPPFAPPSGPIRVCAKKDCWRQGGRELFAALEQGVETRGLTNQVKVKAVGCLDRCKQGPNVDWGDREFSRCRPGEVEALLDRLAAAQSPTPETPPA